jgi:hypothetical protein
VSGQYPYDIEGEKQDRDVTRPIIDSTASADD